MANRRFIDFPIAASVGDNDIVLIWQDGLNKQTTKATLFAGSPNSLAGLTDVDISALANGQILQYNSTTSKWENVDRTDIDLDQLGDVTIVSPTNGQVLVYNSSTSKWENSSAGFVPYTGAVTTVNLGAQSILAGSFVKAGGTSAQFLKADGSVDSTAYGTGSVTSVGLTMPSAFSVANSPITTAGTLAVTGAGTVAQYVRGDGSLADFPATTGGGASVSYYLNGSVSQGTIGGVAYREFNRNPVFGAGTDISISSDGYIASFITDAGDPNKLLIPAGNWNLETYFSASSSGGSPTFYVELYKYDGSTFTLIASSATSPELIAFGTNLNPYFSTLAVPQTTLALTDRLALRYYVNTSGRTITLHTENDHLCQVITTFTTGLTALNGLTSQVQFFAVGTSGTDFNISSSTDTHTFNLPTSSATNRGALSSTDWTTFNNKENAITAGTTAQYFRGDKTFQTLNTSVVPEGTNLYYTEARVNANTNVAANTAARHNAVTLGTANGLSLSTQVLSLGLASAGVTGALSGTDWSTFNSKQNALTNPVTGTGVNGRVAFWNGTNTITSDSDLLFNGNTLTLLTGNVEIAAGNGLLLFNPATTNYFQLYTNSSNELNFGFGGTSPVVAKISSTGVTTLANLAGSGTRMVVADSSGVLSTQTITVGTVTAVTASSPLFSSGGATPNITIQQASGSQSGFLSSTDWTTFNNKQNALTNPVTGTGTTNYLPKFTGSTTIGNSQIIDNGTEVGIGLTPSSGFKLDVGFTGTNRSLLRLSSNAANRLAAITFYGNNIESGTIGYEGGSEIVSGGVQGDLVIRNNLNKNIVLTGANVLVGTTTDSGFKLDVNGTGRFADTVTIRKSISYGTFGPNSSTINLINTSTSETTAGNIQFTGFSGNSVSPYQWGLISGEKDTATGDGNYAGSLTFWSTSGGANGEANSGMYKRMTIRGNGNVGIGTASPSATEWNGSATLLHLYQNSTNGSVLKVESSNASGILAAFNNAMGLGTTSDDPLLLYTNITERMRITSGGNVLIGTTTDTSDKLRVNGTTFSNNIMTWNPANDNRSGVAWRLGAASIGTDILNRRLRVNVGGVEYYIGAVEV